MAPQKALTAWLSPEPQFSTVALLPHIKNWPVLLTLFIFKPFTGRPETGIFLAQWVNHISVAI